MRGDFRKLSSETLYAGRVFSLFEETYAAPTGESFDRQIVRNNGAVAVVPLHDDGTITLIRQYRPSLGKRILEIPAGLLDKPGESTLDGAHRELREEVGLVAGSLELLTVCAPAPGMTDEIISIFLARELSFVGQAVEGPEEEDLEIVRISIGEVNGFVDNGAIVDAKTQLGLLLTLRLLAAWPKP